MPLISIRTVRQTSYQVEVESTDTVQLLKEKILGILGDGYPVNLQKLIYKGKVLENAATIAESGVNETGFVIVMLLTKPIETPAPAPQPTHPTSSTQPSTVGNSAMSGQAATPQHTSKRTPPSQPAATNVSLAVENILSLSLGFSKAEIVQVLDLCNNNIDNAIQLLLSTHPGVTIPQDILNKISSNQSLRSEQAPSQTGNTSSNMLTQQTIQSPSHHASAQQIMQPPSQHAPSQPGSTASNMLAQQLMQEAPDQNTSEASIQQFRQVIKNDPEKLAVILEHIQQSDPQMYQTISANPEAFRRFIYDDSSESSSTAQPYSTRQAQPPRSQVPVMGALSANQGNGGVGASEDSRSIQVALNPEEKESIDRLKEMGFPEGLVVQAYFACDKNEELTANFLLSEPQ